MYDFLDCSNWFLRLSIIFGIAHGIGSIFFFVNPENRPKNILWWIHQFLFNFTGAFIGWVALYYFFESDISKIGIQHFIALIIGFLGVTGYLPFAVMSLLKSDVRKKLLEILK